MKANMLQNVFTIIVKYKKKECAEKIWTLNSHLWYEFKNHIAPSFWVIVTKKGKKRKSFLWKPQFSLIPCNVVSLHMSHVDHVLCASCFALECQVSNCMYLTIALPCQRSKIVCKYKIKWLLFICNEIT